MTVKVKNNIKWSMSFAPVMVCKKLGLEEKTLLNCIMSMKHSFNEVYATNEMLMELTGLSQEQFNTAYSGLCDKNLVKQVDKKWGIRPDKINAFLGVDVYDMDALYKMKNLSLSPAMS